MAAGPRSSSATAVGKRCPQDQQQQQHRQRQRRLRQRRSADRSLFLLVAAAISLALLGPHSVRAESLAPAPASAGVAGGAVAQRPSIILLGDSITEFGMRDGGWHQLLSRDYVRKADVVNRGYSGYNSRWGAYLVDEALEATGPRARLATIFFGANDASPPDRAHGFLSVPVDEYGANLKGIAARFLSAGVTPIVITPPPVNDQDGHFADGARSNERAGVYADAAVAAAKAAGVPFVDLYRRVQAVDGWRDVLMHPDGLHMSDAGNRFIHRAVLEAIAAAAPDATPEALPLAFPSYDRVDVARPGVTFDAVYGRHVEPAGSA